MFELTRPFRLSLCATGLLVVSLLPCTLHAQPVLRDVSPLGLQCGATTRVTIRGDGFGESPRLLLPFEAQQTLVAADMNSATFDVALDESIQMGIYPLRVYTTSGVSQRALIGVDTCAQITDPATETPMPVALTGKVSGAQRQTIEIAAKMGQRLVCDLESTRLGSTMKPVIRVYDARGSQLAWSGPTANLGGDARCSVDIPADGTYLVEVHDMLYRAPGNSVFRLKIGEFTAYDQTLPFAAQIGASYVGRLHSLSGQFADEVYSALLAGEYEGYVPAPGIGFGPRLSPSPRVWLGSSRVVVEGDHAPNQPTHLGAAPLNIQGHLSEGESVDKFQVGVIPGHRYRVEMWSHRMGSPIDGIVVVRGKGGGELGRNDDRPGTTDPMVEVAVPDGVDEITVEVYDLNRSTGEHHAYRVAVEDISVGRPVAVLPQDRLQVPYGGSMALMVNVQRNGNTDPIDLVPIDLPSGWSVSGTHVPANSDRAVVTFTYHGDPTDAVLTQIGCRSTNEIVPPTYASRAPTDVASRLFPWLNRDLALAPSPALPFAVSIDLPETDELPATWAGGELNIPVTIADRNASPEILQIRLLTTQQPQTKIVKVDNQDREEFDPDRTMRLASPVQLANDQDAASITILVPADLPRDQWGYAVAVDTLAENGEPIANRSVTTPTRYFRVDQAFTITVNTTLEIAAGQSASFTGTITRSPGFEGPVQIALTGLPGNYSFEPTSVAADQTEFALTVTAPADATGEIAGLMVTSRAAHPDDETRTIAAFPSIGANLMIKPENQPNP